MKENLKKIFLIFRLGLVVLIIALTYWQIIAGPKIATRPENPRLTAWEKQLTRGQICDRRGCVISFSEDGKRIYKGPKALAPLVGYTSGKRGKSGLEAALGRELLGQLPAEELNNIKRRILGQEPRGSDVLLTVDLRLVEAAAKALGGKRGAVVGIEVDTGQVLVLASSPGYNPNRIVADWESLAGDPASPLLNRPLQGLYPPGSTFKLLTAIGVLHWGLVSPQERFYCPGKVEVEGRQVECFQGKAHGQVTLEQALAVSCNITFVQLAQKLGKERLYRLARSLGMERKPELGVPTSPTQLPPQKGAGSSSISQLAIGQGSLLVTPVQMAMLTAAIASGGTVRSPYLIYQVKSKDTVLERGRSSWQQELESSAFGLVQQYMYAAVERGTGIQARVKGLAVGGKTGTADNPHGRPHAWFVGFAPVERPKLALAVIVENAGQGGKQAAPIAKAVFKAALECGYFR
jgi:peptidoglycan glycosyltransferase